VWSRLFGTTGLGVGWGVTGPLEVRECWWNVGGAVASTVNMAQAASDQVAASCVVVVHFTDSSGCPWCTAFGSKAVGSLGVHVCGVGVCVSMAVSDCCLVRTCVQPPISFLFGALALAG